MELFAAYGDARAVSKLEEIKESLVGTGVLAGRNAPEDLNDFSRSGVTNPEDIRDQFIPNFFFGCERPNDPMNAIAFDSKIAPLRARVGASAQLRHRPLGRHRHARRGRRSLRAGGGRRDGTADELPATSPSPTPSASSPTSTPPSSMARLSKPRRRRGPPPLLLQPSPRRGSTLSLSPSGETERGARRRRAVPGGRPSLAGW